MEHLLTLRASSKLGGHGDVTLGVQARERWKSTGLKVALLVGRLIPAAVLACMAGASVGLLGIAVGAYLTV